MLGETMKKVQQAEAQADQIRKDSRAECAGILEQAKEDAAKQRAELLKAAGEKADALRKVSENEAEKLMESAETELRKEVAALRTMAAGKEKQAIDAVLDALI